MGAWWIALPALVPGLYVLYFFRDPTRSIPAEPLAVVSPADGKVVGVERLEMTEWYDGPCLRVSIFLSIFNVHVNRVPFDGTVRSITYKPGEFLDARNEEATDRNEANTVRMDTPAGPMTVRQISGLVARRIVCAIAEGDSLGKGDRFGMIKFGSRTELYLPVSAQATVAVGDRVNGGATIVARVHERSET